MTLRQQDGKKILDLEPHKVKTYLKYLTEGCLATEQNGEGSERKYIWDYLNQNYGDNVDYRDFLLAIRRFIIDGKIINNDGFYSMHPAVIEEVKKKTPTPALKKSGSGEIMIKFMKDKKSQRQGSKESSRQRDGSVNEEESKIVGRQDGGRSGSSNRNKPSKISNSGKKQKVKPHKESTRQSTIFKYYMKKQMQLTKNIEEFEMSKNQQNKGLGFATPAPENQYESSKEEDSESEEEEPIVQFRDDDEDSNDSSSNMQVSQQKLGFHTQQTPVKKQRGRKPQQSLSQRVEKKTKAITKAVQRSNTKEKKQQKIKVPKSQKTKKSKSYSQDLLDLTPEDNTTSETENRHPIHFLTQPVEKDHHRHSRSASKQQKGSRTAFKDAENQPKQRGRSKKNDKTLDAATIKALKLAIQNKNIRLRQNKLSRVQLRSQSQESHQQSARKMVQKKTKTIIKAKQMRQKITKPTKMRLRGKTLDLTKLGVLSKPKVKLEQTPKRKYTKKVKPASRGATPRKTRKDSVDYDDHILSQRSDRKSQYSQDRQSQTQTQKPKKTQSKSRPSSKLRQKKSKKIAISPPQPGNGSKVLISNIIYYDRKAKIDAAKNLKQLYNMHGTRDGMLIDEKLIYL